MFNKTNHCFRLISLFIVVSIFTTSAFAQVKISVSNKLVSISDSYSLPFIRGVKFDANNPFELEFILDRGNQNNVSNSDKEKLVRYFLAALTIPENKLWVNLSPYEKDRIVDDTVATTEIGETLLAQDYLLKQLSSSLTHPDTPVGKAYWDSKLQITNHKFDDLSKIWIKPGAISLYDGKDIVIIAQAELEVSAESTTSEVLIPQIEKDVNNGRNFAELRQMYHSVLLAQWFKRKFAKSLYSFYFNAEKTAGIDLADENLKNSVFEKYVMAFEKGAYNTIKKVRDPNTNRLIKRKYFSGGADLNASSALNTVKKLPVEQLVIDLNQSNQFDVIKTKMDISSSPLSILMIKSRAKIREIERVENETGADLSEDVMVLDFIIAEIDEMRVSGGIVGSDIDEFNEKIDLLMREVYEKTSSSGIARLSPDMLKEKFGENDGLSVEDIIFEGLYLTSGERDFLLHRFKEYDDRLLSFASRLNQGKEVSFNEIENTLDWIYDFMDQFGYRLSGYTIRTTIAKINQEIINGRDTTIYNRIKLVKHLIKLRRQLAVFLNKFEENPHETGAAYKVKKVTSSALAGDAALLESAVESLSIDDMSLGFVDDINRLEEVFESLIKVVENKIANNDLMQLDPFLKKVSKARDLIEALDEGMQVDTSPAVNDILIMLSGVEDRAVLSDYADRLRLHVRDLRLIGIEIIVEKGAEVMIEKEESELIVLDSVSLDLIRTVNDFIFTLWNSYDYRQIDFGSIDRAAVDWKKYERIVKKTSEKYKEVLRSLGFDGDMGKKVEGFLEVMAAVRNVGDSESSIKRVLPRVESIVVEIKSLLEDKVGSDQIKGYRIQQAKDRSSFFKARRKKNRQEAIDKEAFEQKTAEAHEKIAAEEKKRQEKEQKRLDLEKKQKEERLAKKAEAAAEKARKKIEKQEAKAKRKAAAVPALPTHLVSAEKEVSKLEELRGLYSDLTDKMELYLAVVRQEGFNEDKILRIVTYLYEHLFNQIYLEHEKNNNLRGSKHLLRVFATDILRVVQQYERLMNGNAHPWFKKQKKELLVEHKKYTHGNPGKVKAKKKLVKKSFKHKTVVREVSEVDVVQLHLEVTEAISAAYEAVEVPMFHLLSYSDLTSDFTKKRIDEVLADMLEACNPINQAKVNVARLAEIRIEALKENPTKFPTKSTEAEWKAVTKKVREYYSEVYGNLKDLGDVEFIASIGEVNKILEKAKRWPDLGKAKGAKKGSSPKRPDANGLRAYLQPIQNELNAAIDLVYVSEKYAGIARSLSDVMFVLGDAEKKKEPLDEEKYNASVERLRALYIKFHDLIGSPELFSWQSVEKKLDQLKKIGLNKNATIISSELVAHLSNVYLYTVFRFDLFDEDDKSKIERLELCEGFFLFSTYLNELTVTLGDIFSGQSNNLLALFSIISKMNDIDGVQFSLSGNYFALGPKEKTQLRDDILVTVSPANKELFELFDKKQLHRSTVKQANLNFYNLMHAHLQLGGELSQQGQITFVMLQEMFNASNQSGSSAISSTIGLAKVSPAMGEQINGGIALENMLDGVEISESSSDIVITPEMAADIKGIMFTIIDSKSMSINEIIKPYMPVVR